MKLFVLLIAAFVCIGCVSPAIEKADSALEHRLGQLEATTSRLKTETIAEAKDAAATLIAEATDKFENSGKEVIRSAADQFGSRLDESLDKIDDKVNDKLVKIEDIVDKQREATLKEVRELVRDDVPVAIRESIVQSADKIAERLGVIKKLVPGPDGTPIEVWAIWAGAAGAFWTGLKTFLRMTKKSTIANSILKLAGEGEVKPSPSPEVRVQKDVVPSDNTNSPTA